MHPPAGRIGRRDLEGQASGGNDSASDSDNEQASGLENGSGETDVEGNDDYGDGEQGDDVDYGDGEQGDDNRRFDGAQSPAPDALLGA